jgi:hypothetical protein
VGRSGICPCLATATTSMVEPFVGLGQPTLPDLQLSRHLEVVWLRSEIRWNDRDTAPEIAPIDPSICLSAHLDPCT